MFQTSKMRILYVDGPHDIARPVQKWHSDRIRDGVLPVLREFCRLVKGVDNNQSLGCEANPSGCRTCAPSETGPMCIILYSWPGFGTTLAMLRKNRGRHYSLCFVDRVSDNRIPEDRWPTGVDPREYESGSDRAKVTGDVIIEEINTYHAADFIVVASISEVGLDKILRIGGRTDFWVRDPADRYNFEIALSAAKRIHEQREIGNGLPPLSTVAHPNMKFGQGLCRAVEIMISKKDGKPCLQAFFPKEKKPVKEMLTKRKVLMHRHIIRMRGVWLDENSSYFDIFYLEKESGGPEARKKRNAKDDGSQYVIDKPIRNKQIHTALIGNPIGGDMSSRTTEQNRLHSYVFGQMYQAQNADAGPWCLNTSFLDEGHVCVNIEEAWKAIWHGFHALHLSEELSMRTAGFLKQAESLFLTAESIVQQEGLAWEQYVRDWEMILIPVCGNLCVHSLGGGSDNEIRNEAASIFSRFGELLRDSSHPLFRYWTPVFLPLAHWVYQLTKDPLPVGARSSFQEELLMNLYRMQERNSLYARVFR